MHKRYIKATVNDTKEADFGRRHGRMQFDPKLGKAVSRFAPNKRNRVNMELLVRAYQNQGTRIIIDRQQKELGIDVFNIFQSTTLRTPFKGIHIITATLMTHVAQHYDSDTVAALDKALQPIKEGR